MDAGAPSTPGQTATSSAPSPPTGGGRAYRSRKARPCDRCRRAKHRCDIGPGGPPCSQCVAGKRQCTFDLEPPVRKTAAKPPQPSLPDLKETRTPAEVLSLRQWSRHVGGPRLPGYGPYLFREEREPAVRTSAVDREAAEGYDPFVVTTLLTDDLLPVTNPNDETREHARQISSDPAQPIIMVMKPRPPHRQTSNSGTVFLAHLRLLLSQHPTMIREGDLLALYHSNVHTAWPILPEGPIENMPPELHAATIASSLIVSEPVRPLAMLVASMMENALAGRTEESLSGIATALLMIGIRPQYTSRASSLLLARTIVLAQILGLHINPLRLSISEKEQDLRSRLWWSLVIQDSWMSLLKSRPSLIQADNFSVPLPSLSVILAASCAYATASSDSAKSFIAMCKLALLARKLQSGVGTLGSARRTASSRASIIQSIWNEVDEQRRPWQEYISSTTGRPNGVANYILLLLGFQCLLQRLLIETSEEVEMATAVPPFADFVSFVERMNPDEWRGFFLMNTQQIFTLVMASIIRMSLPDTSPLSFQTLPLLTRFTRQVHSLQSTCAADMTMHAINRAVNTSARFRSTGEYPLLCQAIDDALTAEDTNFDFLMPLLNAGDTNDGLWDFTGWTQGEI